MQVKQMALGTVKSVYDTISTLVYLGALLTSLNLLFFNFNSTGLAMFIPFALLSCVCAVIDYLSNGYSGRTSGEG